MSTESKLREYTNAELATYRRELEHALKTLPVESDVRQLLTRHLDLAVAEQTTRKQ